MEVEIFGKELLEDLGFRLLLTGGLREEDARTIAGDLVAAFLKEGGISAREKEELRKLLDEMEV